jgi:hypothetical protein
MLSLLERSPPAIPSMPRIVGDLGLGLAIAPELPLLEDFLFFKDRNLAR